MKTLLPLLFALIALEAVGQGDTAMYDIRTHDVEVVSVEIFTQWELEKRERQEAIIDLFAEYYEWCLENPDTVEVYLVIDKENDQSRFIYGYQYDNTKHWFHSKTTTEMPRTQTFSGFVEWCYRRKNQ